MAKLSASQIYAYARGAGFSPSQAVIMTAISLAESSGGDPNAHCLNCFPGVTEDSRGLTQINVDAHPQFANLNLYDPADNMAAAYQVSNGGRNFKPWSTYTSGAYSQYLATATAGASGDPTLGQLQPLDTSTSGSSSSGGGKSWYDYLNPITDVQSLLGGVASNVGKDALQIVIEGVLVLGGAALVVIGLWRTVQPTVTKVADVAGDAAKAGAAVA